MRRVAIPVAVCCRIGVSAITTQVTRIQAEAVCAGRRYSHEARSNTYQHFSISKLIQRTTYVPIFFNKPFRYADKSHESPRPSSGSRGHDEPHQKTRQVSYHRSEPALPLPRPASRDAKSNLQISLHKRQHERSRHRPTLFKSTFLLPPPNLSTNPPRVPKDVTPHVAEILRRNQLLLLAQTRRKPAREAERRRATLRSSTHAPPQSHSR